MNNNLFITFIIFNILNVIIQTVKSIATIKCGKTLASLANAIAYGLYTYIVILMVCDLSLWTKILVVGGCNLVGVYIVKVIEEKMQKEKLWKIEVTVASEHTEIIDNIIADIPHNYIKISPKHTLFNFYCATKEQSRQVRKVIKDFDGKCFASESKLI